MADTLQNVTLPEGSWVDIYSASGILAGSQIIVQNIGRDEVRLVTKATEPNDSDGFKILFRGLEAINQSGDSGAWVKSVGVAGSINVRLA
jgi:hypothetical protein